MDIHKWKGNSSVKDISVANGIIYLLKIKCFFLS